MEGARSRTMAAGVSALAGAVSGVVTNLVTDERTWIWIVALTVMTLTLIVLQIWLSLTTPPPDARAVDRGTVAAGGSIPGDVTIDSSGPPPSFSNSPPSFGIIRTRTRQG
jgi:hypothetical protein